jgi:hypothetical protein
MTTQQAAVRVVGTDALTSTGMAGAHSSKRYDDAALAFIAPPKASETIR